MDVLKQFAAAIFMFTASTSAVTAAKLPPFVVVPFGLSPTNLELTVPGMPNDWPRGVETKPWGKGGKCGVHCAHFEGTALNYGDVLSFTNLFISHLNDPNAITVTQIVWSCGTNDDGTPIICSPPQSIWGDEPTGPKKYTPSEESPVYLALVPEPASWAMMVAGFALVGGAMRRRKVAAVA